MGMTNCQETRHRERCYVMCAQGYDLVDDARSLECDLSGAYGHTGGFKDTYTLAPAMAPKCKPKECKMGIPDENAVGVTTDCAGKKTAQTCTVRAKFGYTLDGPAEPLVCDGTGIFRGRVPTAIPKKCQIIPQLKAAGVKHRCKDLPYMATCVAYCDTGYAGDIVEYTCGDRTSVQLMPVGSHV